MADSAAVVSAIAAVVSAMGGAFAAIAAFRSAGFAQAAIKAAQISEKRSALRQLTVTASEISVEAGRLNAMGVELKNSYRTLFTFAKSSGGSRLQMHLGQIDKKLKEVEELSENAKPFVTSPASLMNGPVEEINSREIAMARALTQVRGIREDLEREHVSIEAQNKAYRDEEIKGGGR